MTAVDLPRKYGLLLPNAGYYADPGLLVELARAAEASGWDGVFIWDHLLMDRRLRMAVADSWTVVAAALASTRTILSGPLVTPLAARHPWKVARETATLDRLSGGRLVLGAGLGASGELEFEAFGDGAGLRERAARVDEALTVIDRLWTGEEISHTGTHYRLDRVAFRPTPAQRPRIPVWVAATWPARSPGPMRRALRWDGVVPMIRQGDGSLRGPAPDELASLLPPGPRRADWTVAVPGQSSPDDRDEARAAARRLFDAGATWWLESFDPWIRNPRHARAWAVDGPPR